MARNVKQHVNELLAHCATCICTTGRKEEPVLAVGGFFLYMSLSFQ